MCRIIMNEITDGVGLGIKIVLEVYRYSILALIKIHSHIVVELNFKKES